MVCYYYNYYYNYYYYCCCYYYYYSYCQGFSRVTGCLKCNGSDQEVFQISRVGSGRVKGFSNLAGRVRSGQEFFKSHASGRLRSRNF